MTQSTFIITCWRKTFCDCILIFLIPLKMENMQYLYWGWGFREAFAWQMIKQSYNLQLQHTFPLLYSDASGTEVWRTPCWWVNWPRATTALRGFNRSPVPAHAHREGKLTVWQLAISIRARCTSWPITCFHMSKRVKKGSMAWTCHFSLNSRTKGSGSGFWDPDQSLHLRNRGLITLFTCFARVSMLTLHASGKQLLYFRRGAKNDCQQPQ